MFFTLSLAWCLSIIRNRKVMCQKSGHDNVMMLILIYANRETSTHWWLVISTFLWFSYQGPREVCTFALLLPHHWSKPTVTLGQTSPFLIITMCLRVPSFVKPSKRIAWNPFCRVWRAHRLEKVPWRTERGTIQVFLWQWIILILLWLVAKPFQILL